MIFTFLPLIHKNQGCVWCERIWYITVVKYNSTRFRFKEQKAVSEKKGSFDSSNDKEKVNCSLAAVNIRKITRSKGKKTLEFP